MARPEKHDVDYFPFYVKDGKTLFILESKFGCKGTGFFTNVMRFLCQTPDHHFCIKDPSDRLYFFAKTKCDEVSGAEMLLMMAETGKINKVLWVSDAVIVSEALLESISDAYRKRNNHIITIDEIMSKYVSAAGNEVNSDGNEIKGDDKPQSKVKKSKVNKRREFIPPSIEDVISFFAKKGYSKAAAQKAYEYYTTANWIDSRGNKVLNWKQKMIAVWFKDENKEKQTVKFYEDGSVGYAD